MKKVPVTVYKGVKNMGKKSCYSVTLYIFVKIKENVMTI